MLRNSNLLYLGCPIYALVSDDYITRFWTSVEAWLSLQACTDNGLHPASTTDR